MTFCGIWRRVPWSRLGKCDHYISSETSVNTIRHFISRDMVVRTSNVQTLYLPFNGTRPIWRTVFIWELLATNRLADASQGTAFPRSNTTIRYSWHTLPRRKANCRAVRRYGRSGLWEMERLNIAKVLPFFRSNFKETHYKLLLYSHFNVI
jgi:hypothetical protein